MNKVVSAIKRFAALVLVFAFMFSVVPSLSINVKAADTVKDVIPTKVRTQARMVSREFSINIVEGGYKIANLKSYNKNLKVYVTQQHNYSDTASDKYKSQLKVGMYALKEGKYKVTFNLVKGNKKTKRTVTVFAYNDEPVKRYKFAGKTVDDDSRMVTADAGNFKVIMNKGYKLKSIRVITNVQDSYFKDWYSMWQNQPGVYIKNGQYVSLSKIARRCNHSGEYENEMVAGTFFKVTYIDKYSKEEKETGITLYKMVNSAN